MAGPIEAPTPGRGFFGLEWGQRGPHTLYALEDVHWLVVEVDETDIIARDGDELEFRKCDVLYCGDFAAALALIADARAARNLPPVIMTEKPQPWRHQPP